MQFCANPVCKSPPKCSEQLSLVYSLLFRSEEEESAGWTAVCRRGGAKCWMTTPPVAQSGEREKKTKGHWGPQRSWGQSLVVGGLQLPDDEVAALGFGQEGLQLHGAVLALLPLAVLVTCRQPDEKLKANLKTEDKCLGLFFLFSNIKIGHIGHSTLSKG